MSDDILEFEYDWSRNSSALRLKLMKEDDCVEVDFPDSDEPRWAYLTREKAQQVIEFLQRFLTTPAPQQPEKP